jgi:hypothetical protein
MEGRRDATPLSKRLSRVEFLGEMISFLHSFVLLSVSLITPNPLLPRGEKGVFGLQEAQNERRNVGDFKKPIPVAPDEEVFHSSS